MFSPRRYTCALKRAHGKDFCLSECPARDPAVYDYVRIERRRTSPPRTRTSIDVAILDMNHGWPNMGHDSLVQVVKDAACDLRRVLAESGLRIRALSYEVRQRHMIPEAPGGRFAVYIGTGGPGHIDPHHNDGWPPGSQGIDEDPTWEGPLFALFDGIRESDEARAARGVPQLRRDVPLVGRGAPRAALRGQGRQERGRPGERPHRGRGAAIRGSASWRRSCPDHRRVRVVDHRLFDLIPEPALPRGLTPIGYETRGVEGPPARHHDDRVGARRAGTMPRVFAVNHHPGDRRPLAADAHPARRSWSAARWTRPGSTTARAC